MTIKIHDLPPKERTLIPPDAGWEDRTYYVVEVAFSKSNPIHRSILYLGFGAERPDWVALGGGYTTLFNGSYESTQPPTLLHFLKVIAKIPNIGSQE